MQAGVYSCLAIPMSTAKELIDCLSPRVRTPAIATTVRHGSMAMRLGTSPSRPSPREAERPPRSDGSLTPSQLDEPLTTKSGEPFAPCSGSQWRWSAGSSIRLPDLMRSTRSAKAKLAGRCVMRITVRLARHARQSSMKATSPPGSNMAVASSSTRIGGSLSRARAKAMRWRWPPERRIP